MFINECLAIELSVVQRPLLTRFQRQARFLSEAGDLERAFLGLHHELFIFADDAQNIEEIFADLLAPMDIPGVAGDGAMPVGAMPAGAMFDLRAELRRYEAALIDKAIRIHGSKRKAAKALGVNIGTIVRKTAEPPDATLSDPSTNKRGTTT